MDCTHQAPLSMGFSMQEYWSGLPFPSSGVLPDLESSWPGIFLTWVSNLHLLHCRQILNHWATREFPLSPFNHCYMLIGKYLPVSYFYILSWCYNSLSLPHFLLRVTYFNICSTHTSDIHGCKRIYIHLLHYVINICILIKVAPIPVKCSLMVYVEICWLKNVVVGFITLRIRVILFNIYL